MDVNYVVDILRICSPHGYALKTNNLPLLLVVKLIDENFMTYTANILNAGISYQTQ